MKLLISAFLILASTQSLADGKPSPEELNSFKDAYLYTHYADYKVKEYNDQFSKCFKINEKSRQILIAQYDACIQTPTGQMVPFEKSIGQCSKGTTTKAYFFKDLKDCQDAQNEHGEGANT